MSPAGVQGASAFKVAALGSHSSPPSPPSSQNHACFSLCASCISAFLPRISSRVISFPLPSHSSPTRVSSQRGCIFLYWIWDLPLLRQRWNIFLSEFFLDSLDIFIYIYICTFIERLDRKYWIEFATSKIRRDYVRKVETRWIIFSS